MALGTTLWGWTLAEQARLPDGQGQGEEGIAQMRQGLAAWQATGAELSRPRYLALLAEAYGKVEQIEEGLALLAEALAAVQKSGERFWEAELYRLYGELLLAQESKNQKAKGKGQKSKIPNTQYLTPSTHAEAEAEACFRQAIDIARWQSAKSLELRAVMSLSRLWQKQGRREEARRMLTEIYGWFTEGFDTADLKEAKVLLKELAWNG